MENLEVGDVSEVSGDESSVDTAPPPEAQEQDTSELPSPEEETPSEEADNIEDPPMDDPGDADGTPLEQPTADPAMDAGDPAMIEDTMPPEQTDPEGANTEHLPETETGDEGEGSPDASAEGNAAGGDVSDGPETADNAELPEESPDDPVETTPPEDVPEQPDIGNEGTPDAEDKSEQPQNPEQKDETELPEDNEADPVTEDPDAPENTDDPETPEKNDVKDGSEDPDDLPPKEELDKKELEEPAEQPASEAEKPTVENSDAADDGTDWDRTSLTPEQEDQLREMEKNGEIDIPEEDPNWKEPVQKDGHLPTEKTGTFDGDRGESAFRPNDEAALNKMNEYGRDSVDYKNGNPDFSPFTQHETPYGKMDGQVEIPHMTTNRENPSWEFGRRPDGTSHDPNYDLGNFAQADNALSEKMGNMTPEQVADYRKANNLTWHECPDGKTMQLVPTEIHDACRHSGGVSEQRYRQAMGDITAPTT